MAVVLVIEAEGQNFNSLLAPFSILIAVARS